MFEKEEQEELDYEFSSSESDEECKEKKCIKRKFSWRINLRNKKKICSRDTIFSLGHPYCKPKLKRNVIKDVFKEQKEILYSNITIVQDVGQDMPCSSSDKIRNEWSTDSDDFTFSLINTEVMETNLRDFSITTCAVDRALQESEEQRKCIFFDVCPHYFELKPCDVVKCPLLHNIPPDRLDWCDFDAVLDQYNLIKTQPALSKLFSMFLKYFIGHGDKNVLVNLFEDVSDDTNAHYLADIIDGLVTLGMEPVDAVNSAIDQTRPIREANDVLLNYIIKMNLISEVRFLEQLIGLREEPLPMQFVGNLINLFISRHSSNIELGLFIKTRIFDSLDKSEVKKFPPFCINAFLKILSKH